MSKMIKLKSILLCFSGLFIFLFFSCNSTEEYEFYVPEIPFKVGHEELGDQDFSNLKYKFELFKYEYIINLAIEKELYDKTTQLPKTILLEQGEQLSSQVFYDTFLSDENDELILNDILEQINNRTIGNEFDPVQVIVNFVQSIPYEEAKSQKYPIETLYLKKGDCSDKSVLLAKLLYLSGFDVCLFVYEKAQHMAVGIATDNPKDAYKSGYIYIESTGYSKIGEIPKEFVGGIKIEEEPEIVIFEEGNYPISGFSELKKMYNKIESKYGENYFITNKSGKLILEEINVLDSKLHSVKKNIQKKSNDKLHLEKVLEENHCFGNLEEAKYNFCTKIKDSLRFKINEYNNLVVKFNSINDSRNNKIRILNNINRNNYIKN